MPGPIIEVWPDKICFTYGSKCYHRAAYQMFNQSHWWVKGKGFMRSVCGVIDSHQFAHFWCFNQTDEKFLSRVRNGQLVACKRCFPDGPPALRRRDGDRGTVAELAKEETMNFHQWMTIIENIVWKTVGCSVYDLPDCLFRDWYEDGLTPKEAAQRAIKEA